MARQKWAARPNQEAIREICNAQSYARGKSYYAAGRVLSAYIDGNELYATVRGTTEYEVTAENRRDGSIGINCTCQYRYSYYSACKHIVAVMMHLSENFERMVDEAEHRKEIIDHMLTLVPPGKALKFLAESMDEDEALRQEFISKFNLENVHLEEDYKKEVDRAYFFEAESDGRILKPLSFERYFSGARKRWNGGEATEAAKAYKGMSESIAEHMDRVDDSSEYYTDCFIEALEAMAELMARDGFPADEKREHMSYLLERFMEGRPGGFAPHYRGALETACTTDEDFAHLHDLIGPHLQKGGSADLVRMQAGILKRLGRTAELESLLEEHRGLDRVLCSMYLDAAEPENARRAATDAVGAFPGDALIMESALRHHPKDSPEYAAILADLFAATGDWRHFLKLREVSADWPADVERIAGKFLDASDPGMAVSTYVKGDLADGAMDLLESLGDIELLAEYRTRLARTYPGRYLAAYGSAIRSFARSRTGKDHYVRVRRHLEGIRTVPGDGYGELLRLVRRENSNRRILLRTIEDL